MIDRNQLVPWLDVNRDVVCGWLDQFINSVPGYLASARTALAAGDAAAVETALHDGKNAICFAGAAGRLREAAVEALGMCGTTTAPRLPEDPARFLRLLEELEIQHTRAAAGAARLREEFGR
jgi:hypothetical protein